MRISACHGNTYNNGSDEIRTTIVTFRQITSVPSNSLLSDVVVVKPAAAGRLVRAERILLRDLFVDVFFVRHGCGLQNFCDKKRLERATTGDRIQRLGNEDQDLGNPGIDLLCIRSIVTLGLHSGEPGCERVETASQDEFMLWRN